MDDLIIFDSIIMEASPHRSALLKEIEEHIVTLQSNRKDNAALQKINSLLKRFTKVKNLVFKIQPGSDNAYCITLYKDTINSTILDIFKKQPDNLNKPLKRIEEDNAQYIDGLYIILGNKLLKQLTPQQNVAILLHEIGHAYNHTTNIPNWVNYIHNKLKAIQNKMFAMALFMPGGSIIFTLGFIIGNFSKTLSFFDHATEYNADKFATKYGYGEEMAQVLYKFHRSELREKKRNTPKNFLSRILKALYVLVKPGETHPLSQDRLCRLKKLIYEDYKRHYPEISSDLTSIYGNLKC